MAVERNHGQITNGLRVCCASFSISNFHKQVKNICLNFLIGGSNLEYPSSITCNAGKNFSEPITLVGLQLHAKAIVWPTAEIA